MSTIATKTDVSELRAELRDALRAEHADVSAQITLWMTTSLVSLFFGFGGLFFAIYSLLRDG